MDLCRHVSPGGQLQLRLNSQDSGEQYTIQHCMKNHPKAQNQALSIHQVALGPIPCALLVEIVNGPDPLSHIAQILKSRRV